MLVGTDDGAIDNVEQPVQAPRRIGLRLEDSKEPLPDASPLPSREAAGHRLPGALALGEIPPGGARAQDPQDAIDDQAMIMGGSPGVGFLGWEQQVEPLPWLVLQVMSVHAL